MKSQKIRILGIIILVFAVNINSNHLWGQQKDIKAHRVLLKKMNGEKVEGYLFDLDEVGITLAKTKKGQYETLPIFPVSEVKKIKIRRKGAVLRGAAWGTLFGAMAGTILGYTVGESAYCQTETGLFGGTYEACYPDTRGDNAIGFGVLFGVLGGTTGAIIGTKNKKYHINGNTEAYEAFQEEWQSLALEKRLKQE